MEDFLRASCVAGVSSCMMLLRLRHSSTTTLSGRTACIDGETYQAAHRSDEAPIHDTMIGSHDGECKGAVRGAIQRDYAASLFVPQHLVQGSWCMS